MRRGILSERQRAFATLIGLGQYQHKEIAQMLNIHRNSVRNWLRDERIQTLVSEVQERMQNKLESLAVQSTVKSNSPLMQKAAQKLDAMLDGRSVKRQLMAIDFLLNGSMPSQEKQQDQREHETFIRIDPVIYNRVQAKQSSSIT
jgi:ParB-like chromosome segregation protein Spo0J